MTIEIHHIRAGDEGLFARIADEVLDYAAEITSLARCLTAPDHLLVVVIARSG